jgi:hypothetical protein
MSNNCIFIYIYNEYFCNGIKLRNFNYVISVVLNLAPYTSLAVVILIPLMGFNGGSFNVGVGA